MAARHTGTRASVQIVRYAEPADAPGLLILMQQLATFEGYADRFRVKATDLLQRGLRATEIGRQPQFTAIVAETTADELVGYAVVYEIPFTYDLRPTLVLKELFVSANARGTRIGSALLRAVLRHAKSRDCGRLKWEVLRSNDRAKTFYRRFGAERDSAWENWILQLDHQIGAG